MNNLNDVICILSTGYSCMQSYPCIHYVKVLTNKFRITKRGVSGNVIAKWYYEKNKKIPIHFKEYICMILNEYIKNNQINDVLKLINDKRYIKNHNKNNDYSQYIYYAIFHNRFDIAMELFNRQNMIKEIDLTPGKKFQIELTKIILDKDDDDDINVDLLSKLISKMVPQFDIMLNLKILADSGNIKAWKELPDISKNVTDDQFRSFVSKNNYEMVNELINHNYININLLKEVIQPKDGWKMYKDILHDNNYQTIKIIKEYLNNR